MENLPKRQGYLVATNIQEAKEVAEIIASTDFLPKSYRDKNTNNPKINEIIIAGDMGARHGWNMFQSLQAICVINNRPSIWGEYFWGLILSDPRFVKSKETWDKDLDGGTWTVEIWKKNSEFPIIGTFSLQEAATAGLLHNKSKENTWGKYPKDMTLWRARGRAGKAGFSDAIQGFVMVEEARDIVDVTYQVLDDDKKQLPQTRTGKLKTDLADKLKDKPIPPEEPKPPTATKPAGSKTAPPKKDPPKPATKKKDQGEDKDVIRNRVADFIENSQDNESLIEDIESKLGPALKKDGHNVNATSSFLVHEYIRNKNMIIDPWLKTMDDMLKAEGFYK